ncbi:MAG: ferritin family protein [Thermoplasmata archaeon]|nr:ferritin family protein [Thermoplasmata archaeon]
MTDLEKLIEIAIKSEIVAAENYRKAADMINIYLLKDKFRFLEKEEIGHRKALETLFKRKFPDREITLPDISNMPFPEFEVNEEMELPEIIEKAMEAEKYAMDFYREMEGKLEGDEEKAMARYLASMEESHYHLLKSELEIVHNFELYDEIHAMMHVGP